MKKMRLMAFVSIVALSVGGSLFAATKKSVNINLLSDMTFNGKEIRPGQYKITFDEGGGDSSVAVIKDGKVVAEGHAKIVERDTAAPYDAVVSKKNGNGSLAMTEIQLKGKKTVLVISES